MNPGRKGRERAGGTGARLTIILLVILSAALLTVSCADTGRAQNSDTRALADSSLSGDTVAEPLPGTSAENTETSKEKETEKEETTMTIPGPVNEPVILKKEAEDDAYRAVDVHDTGDEAEDKSYLRYQPSEKTEEPGGEDADDHEDHELDDEGTDFSLFDLEG